MKELLSKALPEIVGGVVVAAIVAVAQILIQVIGSSNLLLIGSVVGALVVVAGVLWHALKTTKTWRNKRRVLGLVILCASVIVYSAWVGTQISISTDTEEEQLITMRTQLRPVFVGYDAAVGEMEQAIVEPLYMIALGIQNEPQNREQFKMKLREYFNLRDETLERSETERWQRQLTQAKEELEPIRAQPDCQDPGYLEGLKELEIALLKYLGSLESLKQMTDSMILAVVSEEGEQSAHLAKMMELIGQVSGLHNEAVSALNQADDDLKRVLRDWPCGVSRVTESNY